MVDSTRRNDVSTNAPPDSNPPAPTALCPMSVAPEHRGRSARAFDLPGQRPGQPVRRDQPGTVPGPWCAVPAAGRERPAEPRGDGTPDALNPHPHVQERS